MDRPISNFILKSLMGCPVQVTPLKTDVSVRGGCRMKATKDGTLWLNNYEEINVLQVDPKDRTKLTKIGSFPAPVTCAGGYPYRITSVADFYRSPILALQHRIQDQDHLQHIDHGLIQVDYEGKLDCVIAGGPFYQITSSSFNKGLICGIRSKREISFYEYDEENNGNKWIHDKDIFLDKDYSRIQLRKGSVLVGGEGGTHIDEIDMQTGGLIGTVPIPTHHKDGMYLCCVDDEEAAFVVDLKAYEHHTPDAPDKPVPNMYILQKGTNQLTPIATNIHIRQPHDATLFNGKLLVLDNDGNLYELEPGQDKQACASSGSDASSSSDDGAMQGHSV